MSREPGSTRSRRDTSGAVHWWFVRSFGKESRGSSEEAEDWRKWSSDSANQEESAHVDQIWSALGDPASERRLNAPESTAARHTEVALSQATESSGRVLDWGIGGRAKWYVPAVPMMFILCLLYGADFYRWLIPTPAAALTYANDGVQSRVVSLADGSLITLGARTHLSVLYTNDRRAVRLERGEAVFSVAHNATRPFVVLAGIGSITAVGTQFDVTRELDSDVDRVSVIVKEGTVEVAPPAPQKPSETPNASAPTAWQPDRITEGQALSYDVTGKIARLPDVDVEDVGSWVEGRLEYRHTPLQLVIPRVSRYNAKPIVVTDDVAGTLPFSGLIFVGQIESFLQALQAAYPVEIIERTDRLEIRSRTAALRSDH